MGSNASALVARLGLDSDDMRLGLTEAVKHAQWAQNQMQKAAENSARAQQEAARETARVQKEAAQEAARVQQAYQANLSRLSTAAGLPAGMRGITGTGSFSAGGSAEGGGGHGGGGGFAAAHIAGDALDAATGERGWVMKLNLLRQLGPAGAAVAAVGIAIMQTVESMKELKKANDALGASLKMTAYGEEGIASKRESLQKNLGDMETTRNSGFFKKTFVGMMTRGVMSTVTGHDQELESFRKQEAAEEELARLDGISTERVREQIKARMEAAHGSQLQGEIMALNVKTEEKLAALTDQTAAGKMGLQEYHERQKLVAAESSIEEETIRKKFAAQARELGLESKLLDIKREGKDVEVESASARLSLAVGNAKAAESGTKEEKDSAAIALQTAQDAYDDAKRQRTEREANFAMERQIAGLQGSSDDKHLAALKIEQKFLEDKLARAKPDEREAIALDLQRNAAAQNDAGIRAGLKTFDTKNAQIDIGTGTGAAEQQRALIAKINNEQHRLVGMTDAGIFDDNELAAQGAKIIEMRKNLQEMLDAKSRALGGEKAATLELEMQANHQGKMAEMLKTALGYQEKINKARRDGNGALADELTKQQGTALGMQANQAAKDNADQYKATLPELAANGMANGSGRARQAQYYEDKADMERKRGFEDHAKSLEDRARRLMQGIEPLKNSEKDKAATDLTASLNGCTMAADIAKLVEKYGKAL